MGFLIAVLATAASADEGQPMGKVARMYAESNYHDVMLYKWAEKHASWEFEVIRSPDDVRG